MAKAYPVEALGLAIKTDPYLGGGVARTFLEGSSQTFLVGWPVMLSSGLLVEWTSGNLLLGFAQKDASGTSGSEIPVILASPDVEMEGNLLEASAASHTLTADDMGAGVGLVKNANLLGTSLPGWYLEIDDTPTHARIVDFRSDYVHPDNEEDVAKVGDTKARVRARLRADTVVGAITALTDNSGGTAADTIAVIGATYDQAEVRNAVASLAAKINAIIAGS